MKKLITTISILLIVTSAHAQTYTVERVIGGATLKLTNGEEVRLIGIDTSTMGQEATEFVKSILPARTQVRLEFDVQERDKYGRLLAYVYVLQCKGDCACYVNMAGSTDPEILAKVSGEHYCVELDSINWYDFINASIIKAGYATPMTIPTNVKHAELFEKLYQEARDEKQGSGKEKDPAEGISKEPEAATPILQSIKVVEEGSDFVIIDAFYLPEKLLPEQLLLSAIPLIDGSSPGHFSVGVDAARKDRNSGRIRIGMNSTAPDYCSNEIQVNLYFAHNGRSHKKLVVPYEKCWKKRPVQLDRSMKEKRLRKVIMSFLPTFEKVGEWIIRGRPIAAVSMAEAIPGKDWLNAERYPVSLSEALTGPGLIDTGFANVPKGAVIDFHFRPHTLRNGKGVDLLLLEARYDAGEYEVSTDYDGFTASYKIGPAKFADTKERRAYFYSAYGERLHPFKSRVFAAPIDLSLLGIPEEATLSVVRVKIKKDGCDFLGLGSLYSTSRPVLKAIPWVVIAFVIGGVLGIIITRRRKGKIRR